MFESEDAKRAWKDQRATARGEGIRADLAAKLRASGPQTAAQLQPQMAADVSLSEVAFQLGRLAEDGRAVGSEGKDYRLAEDRRK
jgi:hypothetical protein